MSNFCLNCKKPLPKGVQSSFCGRNCWLQYKENKGLAIRPERQATIMLKDTSKNLITSLKSELDKKDEIIKHQDSLIHEYRESLESREKEILKLQTKIRYLDGVVSEMKQQASAAVPGEPAVAPPSAPMEEQPVQTVAANDEYHRNAQAISAAGDIPDSQFILEDAIPSSMPEPNKQPFWRRLLQRLKYS